MDQLDGIAALPDQKIKADQYRAVLQTVLAKQQAADCKGFVDHLLSDAVPLVVSRQLLSNFAQEVSSLPPELHKEVARYALERVQPRVVSYEEQVTTMREGLADCYEAEDNWAEAAKTLAMIDLDSGMRVVDAEYKLSKNVKIAMLFLEDEDPVNAELYIKKASSLLTSTKNEELELMYKTCYARILDSKRRFIQAATQFYELSQTGQREVAGKQVSEDELQEALTAAVTCCILAAAGPQRSRVLANLYKDERTRALPVFPFLERVYLEHILRRDQVEAFAETLKPHQRAVTADGTTVLDKAVIDHNLAAASKLYNNIYFTELGQLLGCSEEQAEATASQMVMEDRLQASIDQVIGLVSFNSSSEQLLQWDAQIQSICGQLNGMIDKMANKGIKIEA
eukprot:jgi/Astpho2/125/fgenesh1_pm.00004_%23_17_t